MGSSLPLSGVGSFTTLPIVVVMVPTVDAAVSEVRGGVGEVGIRLLCSHHVTLSRVANHHRQRRRREGDHGRAR